MKPTQNIDSDGPGTLNLGLANATDFVLGAPLGATGTQHVYINQGGTSLGATGGSGVQVASAVADQGSFGANQYGAHLGVPGVVGFKSRGPTIGDLTKVLAGDILARLTALGVAGDNATIPVAGLVSIVTDIVAATFIAPRFSVQLVPPEGPASARREMFSVTPFGAPSLQENVNRGAGLATLNSDGIALVSHSFITANTRITLTIQPGTFIVPSGVMWVADITPGVGFEIDSTAGGADQGVVLYYQVWDVCDPSLIP